MREFGKSRKLDNVLYDVRGPVVDEAARMEENGTNVLKLNIGNPVIPIHLQNVQCVRGSRKSMPLSAATDIQLCKSSKYFIKKLLPELMTLSGDR